MIRSTRTTIDAVAAALESVDPAWLHARASRFDEADSHLASIADGFRSIRREVIEVWQRYEAGGAPPVLGERSTQALRRLNELRSRVPGAALRRAADSLSQARLELRNLRASGAGAPDAAAAEERAIAVLNRVSQDFAEAGGELLALPYGPPTAAFAGRGPSLASSAVQASTTEHPRASVMELAAADDVDVLGRRDFGPGLNGLGSLPHAMDAANPAGGQPMMPFMPMGMGMGAMGPTGNKDRPPGGHGTADPGTWHEPDNGWDTVGRAGRSDESGRSTQRERTEREVERMIDDLRDGRRDPMMVRRRI